VSASCFAQAFKLTPLPPCAAIDRRVEPRTAPATPRPRVAKAEGSREGEEASPEPPRVAHASPAGSPTPRRGSDRESASAPF